MELSESEIRLLKEKTLETFKYTKNFLEKHNLRYVACCGTALGAVRHKGFIPWDDDIDIYIPREDYAKLILLDAEAQKDGYRIFSIETTPGYYNAWGKVVMNDSSLWEVEMYPFMVGAFVDLFPLDELPYDDDKIAQIQHESERLFNNYVKSFRKYGYTDLLRFILNAKRSDCISWFKSKFFNTNKWYKAYFDFQKKHIGLSGDKTVNLDTWGGKIFESEWFKDTIEVPFEDTTIIIPREYDKYLTLLYGDYMTPPPVDKQVTHHYHFFVDLQHHVDIDEAKKIIKNREQQ